MAFEGLTEKISSAFKHLRSKGRLTESDIKEAMREIRMALLEADVNFSAVACRADPGVRLRDELHERRCDGTHGVCTPVRRSVVHDDDLRGALVKTLKTEPG